MEQGDVPDTHTPASAPCRRAGRVGGNPLTWDDTGGHMPLPTDCVERRVAAGE
jgi:hypothetical protein